MTRSGTTIRTEAIAGVTTFLTMAYIVFVNPQILGNAGMDKGAVFVATCLAAAASTAMMGLYANYPIALAPGMGLNAFFAFTIVLTYKYTWQQALAAVFCSGFLFFLLSIFRIRQYVIEAIPQNLKLAISAGVGLFLGIIALQTAGVVVDHPATLVTLGDLKKPAAILAIAGFVLIAALNARRVIGATLLGILIVTLIGIPFGLTQYSGIVSMPPSLAPTFLQLDFSRAFELTFLTAVLSLLLVDVFDNAGTLIGVTHRTGLMKDGKLERMKEALISDSFAAMFGSLLGTSTTTSYIESASGVSAGGRTGLTAVFVALLFLLALFFAPLAGMVPAYASAAALLFVATLMARGLAEIDWDDVTEYAPAVVTAVAMPLTYSIATGIGLGFLTYALVKIVSGRFTEASPAVIGLAVIFALKFAFT
ncbi:MAG TPA: NCS2 family permease [Beijerinckiaceae bacterium]|nr:NCS2 family permease [Beijerinckiaceae bacterium]